MIAAILLALIQVSLLGREVPPAVRTSGTLPNPRLTPGQVRPLTRADVCTIRWGRDRRHVTRRMKRQVAAAYHVRWSSDIGRRVEFDHLVPRELAGADVVENLWPQPWPSARRKDRLENALHRAVCSGRLSLTAAQDAIRRNWVAAYRRYVAGR